MQGRRGEVTVVKVAKDVVTLEIDGKQVKMDRRSFNFRYPEPSPQRRGR